MSCAIAAAIATVVVSVVRGEHHSVVWAKCVTGVAQVARHLNFVVARLVVYNEPLILSPIPAGGTTLLQVKSQFVRKTQRQSTEPVVSNPVVAIRATKPDFELLP